MKYEEKPRQIPDGRYYVKITNDDDKRVFVQLNNTHLVDNGDEDVTLTLSESNQAKIREYDAQNISTAKTHCENWFGKQLAEKTLETAYSKSLTETSMNVSKIVVKNKVHTKIYDHTKEEVELTGEQNCDVILELSGLWFMKKTYGPVWRLVQVRLKAPPKKKVYVHDEYMFQDDDQEADGGGESSDDDFF